jgi:hypothetical protein
MYVHLLATQAAVAFIGAVHAAPHLLQFIGSFVVSEQVPAHSICPAPQPILQLPLAHDVPPVHA